MQLFEFIDKLRAESDYPGAQVVISHEHEPDPRILPEDYFDKENPRPTEDDREDQLRWDVEVRHFGEQPTGKRAFAIVTRRDLTVIEVLVEGPKADYVTAAYRVANEIGVG